MFFRTQPAPPSRLGSMLFVLGERHTWSRCVAARGGVHFSAAGGGIRIFFPGRGYAFAPQEGGMKGVDSYKNSPKNENFLFSIKQRLPF